MTRFIQANHFINTKINLRRINRTHVIQIFNKFLQLCKGVCNVFTCLHIKITANKQLEFAAINKIISKITAAISNVIYAPNLFHIIYRGADVSFSLWHFFIPMQLLTH